MLVRTVRIPIAEVLSGEKSEFYKDLRETLDLSRKAANLCMTECLRADDMTAKSMDIKAVSHACYHAINTQFPGTTVVASSIVRTVVSHYKKNRWEIINGRRSCPVFRSFPWTLLHNKSKHTFTLAGNDQFVEARLRLLGAWWVVRLRGGSNYRHQVNGLRNAIAGDAYGDSEIAIDRKSRVATMYIATKRQVASAVPIDGLVASVTSTRDHLLSMTLPNWSVPFVIDCSDIREWKEQSTRRQAEYRIARKHGANKSIVREKQAALSGKLKNRLKSKIQESVSQVVSKAVRCKVSEVEIDFAVKSFCPEFPWYELKQCFCNKCEEVGIVVKSKEIDGQCTDPKKPHIYFTYMPSHRVKIGRNGNGEGRLKSNQTHTGPDAFYLSVLNFKKTDLVKQENYFLGLFDAYRIGERDKAGREVFNAEPVIEFLREREWLGNSGNHWQIREVLGEQVFAPRGGHLQAESDGVV